MAYEALLRQSMKLCNRLARRLGASAGLVDDIVQETLISLHHALHTYDSDRSFDAWLAAICRRRAADLLRRAGQVGHREVNAPEAFDNAADAGADPADEWVRQAEHRRLHRALGMLPPAQRDAVWRIFVAEEPAREAGQASGRNAGAVRVNLYRALRGLRTLLNNSPCEPELEPKP